MGNYSRGSTEQLLFAIKGNKPLKMHDVKTHFEAPLGENIAKNQLKLMTLSKLVVMHPT